MVAGVRLGAVIGGRRRPVGDPLLQQRYLRRREGLALMRRGHSFVGVCGHDPLQDQAGPGVPPRQGRTGLPALEDRLCRIQPEICFLFEGTMAGKTPFPEQRFDLFHIVHPSLQGSGQRQPAPNGHDGSGRQAAERVINHDGRREGQEAGSDWNPLNGDSSEGGSLQTKDVGPE